MTGIRVGGVWQDIDSCSVRVGGTWRTVDNIHIRVGGTWRQVWSGYTAISASISPAGYSNTVSNNTGPYSVGFTCNVSGGDGSHTYTWSVNNTSGSGWSLSSGQGTSSIVVNAANGFDAYYEATVSCLVSDGTSSDTPSVSVDITYGVPP